MRAIFCVALALVSPPAAVISTTTPAMMPAPSIADEAAPPRAAKAAEQVTIRGGVYRPLFPPSAGEKEIAVSPFRLDTAPVTAGEFLEFVSSHPAWRRDRVARVFADEGYLGAWESPGSLGTVGADEPVVGVSWFAARAYCASRGARLPSEAEWEHAAAASTTRPDGDADPSWRATLATVYSRPSLERRPRVRASEPNFWGVYDLHGLVWEWVSDFGNAASAFAGDSSPLSFCGAAASGATATTGFAAFQRVAMRTSLRADYTTRNLGFRCAADLEGTPR